MSTINMHGDTDFGRRQRADERQYRLLLCAVYPFFLVLAVAARMTRHESPVFPAGRSVFAQAHAAANTCLPFAFR